MRRPASLLWVHEGVLVAQRFDPERKVISGEPIPVAQDVGLDDAVLRGAFAVSATGVLAHRAGGENGGNLPGWIAQGIARGTVGPPDEDGLSSPDLAPDGQRVCGATRSAREYRRVDDGDWPGRAELALRSTRATKVSSVVAGWDPRGVSVLASRRLQTCLRKRRVALATSSHGC